MKAQQLNACDGDDNNRSIQKESPRATDEQSSRSKAEVCRESVVWKEGWWMRSGKSDERKGGAVSDQSLLG